MHEWINAVAGSGKTTLLVSKINSFKEGPILCISFSNSAVCSMQRAFQHHNHSNLSVNFNTIHSVAATLTSITPNPYLGYPDINTLYPIFGDQLITLQRQYPNWYKVLQQSFYSFAQLDETSQPCSNSALMVKISKTMVNLRRDVGIFGYSELIDAACKFLDSHSLHSPPKHILIDEAQDTNQQQWNLIQRIFYESANIYPDATITVAGDPNQAIYSYNENTTWDTALHWWQKTTNASCKVAHVSHRCSIPIINTVNRIFSPIHHANNRQGSVTINTSKLSSTQCAQHIAQHISTLPPDQSTLVLVKRRGEFLRILLQIFDDSKIKHSGLSLPCQSVITSLKWAVEPENESLLVDMLEYFLAPEALYSALRSHLSLSVIEALQQSHPNIADIILSLSASLNDPGAFLCKLSKHYPINDSTLDQCAALERCTFQEILALFSNTPDLTPIPYHTRISTIHGAKGLEADHVIIADSNESPMRIPRDFDISSNKLHLRPAESNTYLDHAVQQSRNLLYVALTRARKSVHLCGKGNIAKDSFTDIILSNDAINIKLRKT